MNKKAFALCLALILPAAALVQSASALAQPKPADRKEDHDALRTLLAQGAEALNKRNFDTIAKSVHPNFVIITADNQKHVGLDAFRKYYTGLFDGPNAVLKNFEAKVTADDETRFVEANTGVSYGTSQETYTFRDGDVRTMQTRWSAVMKKENDGWKLVNVHFSASVLDNPVVEGVKSFYVKLAIGAAVLGLLIGAALLALMRRRPA
jgi:uncharacterized protein (TIGR02246 family)